MAKLVRVKSFHVFTDIKTFIRSTDQSMVEVRRFNLSMDGTENASSNALYDQLVDKLKAISRTIDSVPKSYTLRLYWKDPEGHFVGLQSSSELLDAIDIMMPSIATKTDSLNIIVCYVRRETITTTTPTPTSSATTSDLKTALRAIAASAEGYKTLAFTRSGAASSSHAKRSHRAKRTAAWAATQAWAAMAASRANATAAAATSANTSSSTSNSTSATTSKRSSESQYQLRMMMPPPKCVEPLQTSSMIASSSKAATATTTQPSAASPSTTTSSTTTAPPPAQESQSEIEAVTKIQANQQLTKPPETAQASSAQLNSSYEYDVITLEKDLNGNK